MVCVGCDKYQTQLRYKWLLDKIFLKKKMSARKLPYFECLGIATKLACKRMSEDN